MSMKLHVYVGPFVECERGPNTPSWGDICPLFDEDLHIAGDGPENGIERWLPNKSKHGVVYSQGDSCRTLVIDDPGETKDSFVKRYPWALRVLRQQYAKVAIRYGAVPYWA